MGGVTETRVEHDLVRLPGGQFRMGSDRFYPEEAPSRIVEIAPFAIQRAPVTNRQFAAFVADTGYVTEAERAPDPALFPGADPARLKPGALVFRPLRAVPASYEWRLWWSYRPGAQWRKPEGDKTVFAGRLDHPVVSVCHTDALAYAEWAGLRLPTEAEWEYAARGGLDDKDYAWGDAFDPDAANIWRGPFPVAADKGKAIRTTPVGRYPANGFGLVDMIGNVWEWTADHYRDPTAPGCCSPMHGPDALVLKGGSHLCAPEYCMRYRPAARQPQTPDTATTHIVFRCAL